MMTVLVPVFLSLLWSLVLLYPRLSWSHGRLIEPPSRSTMWRYGFNNPPNYNDHESYCGGFTRQWQTNRGRCGVCGDPWDEQQVSGGDIWFISRGFTLYWRELKISI